MREASRPRLLVVAGTWPCVNGHSSAADVVSYQLLSGLAATNRLELSFIRVGTSKVAPPAAARSDLDTLSAAGVVSLRDAVIPTVRLRDRPLANAGNLVLQRWECVMKGYGQHDQLLEAVGGSMPDCVLTIWSEFASALVAGLAIPKYAYYGNLEYRNLEAQHQLAELELASRSASLSPLQRAQQAASVGLVRRGHFGVLRKFERVWNVSKADADEQRAGGIRASYLSNTWPAAATRPIVLPSPSDDRARPLKIIGSVGRMSATANTFGLLTLSREILPSLRRRLGDGNFEIHLFGRPPPRDFVSPGLNDPHIKLRGFVDDLESEMRDAAVFLVANNHGRYKAGHTRILHAWSLGCCVVAAEDTKLAMPELVDGENILLGRTPDDIAALVARAGADAELRERIDAGGKRTLGERFNSNDVARVIADDILSSLKSSDAARRAAGS